MDHSKKGKYVLKERLELSAVNPGFEDDAGVIPASDQKIFSSEKSYGSVNDNKKEKPLSLKQAEEAGPARQQWGNSVEFLMSCIAMSVGLGNVWRFPFTAYENGGGAFLIPYIIVLLVIGKPLYYMEMTLGQFSGYGCIKSWAMVPGFKGIGLGQILATIFVLTYYCALMAITVFYFIFSFQSPLPWSTCMPEWTDCMNSSAPAGNATPHSPNLQSSAALFFQRYLLREVDNIDYGIGLPDWRLTLCLVGVWISVFLVLVRGVQSSGKVAYFLAIFPYVVLITLLGRCAALDGALDGIVFFFKPQWEKLLTIQVWFAAVGQAFFSLGVCFGSLTMYASYNSFTHNLHRDVLIVTTMDTFTSLLAGSATFAILGHLAHELDKSVADVVDAGTGLAFISYPEAVAKFDFLPQLFAVLFFLMLYTLGIGSAVGLANSVITIVCDQFEKLRLSLVVAGTCLLGFLVGLVYITPGGQFVLTLVDEYAVTYPIQVLATIEMIGIAWVYGLENFCDDVEFMLERKVSWYWRVCWGAITPVMLLSITCYAFRKVDSLAYKEVEFSMSDKGIGWALLVFVVLQVPIGLVYRIMKNRYQGSSNPLADAFQPSSEWGPKNFATREEWMAYKSDQAAARKDLGPCRRTLRALLGCDL